MQKIETTGTTNFQKGFRVAESIPSWRKRACYSSESTLLSYAAHPPYQRSLTNAQAQLNVLAMMFQSSGSTKCLGINKVDMDRVTEEQDFIILPMHSCVTNASVAFWLKSFGSCWGGVHQFCLSMDNILRSLESLSRTELVWLNTYLVGRLRALPPDNDTYPTVPGMESPGSVAMQGPDGVTSLQEAAVAPLPDRIDALNSSLDPWERTGAAPQGWAAHLRQTMVPIQGYIQLRPQTEGTLPAFGFDSQSPSSDKAVP